MHERKIRPRPFENSLAALAQVALTESGADGYALFRRDSETHALSRVLAFGAEVPADAGNTLADPFAIHTLGEDGLLIFAFRDSDRKKSRGAQLDSIVRTIESVWVAAQTSARYSELASHVADLETRLMDSRISDRVRGYLRDQVRGNGGSGSLIEAITKHVEGVLDPNSASRALEKLSQELEDEVEERRITNRAKAILQSVHGMSEEQAHVHLRQTSRKTRRKVRDVAVDLIERHPESGGVLPGQQRFASSD